jgi:hypothetical protein
VVLAQTIAGVFGAPIKLMNDVYQGDFWDCLIQEIAIYHQIIIGNNAISVNG